MDKLAEAISGAGTTIWHSLVWHQVLIGFGGVLLSLAIFYVLYRVNKKHNVLQNIANVNYLITFGLIALLSLSILGYSVAHILNPGYFAIQDGVHIVKH